MTEGKKCAKGHDLTAEDATYQGNDGRTRCRECKRARQRRSRLKAKRRKAEEARGAVQEEAKEAPTTAARLPRASSREQQALYRHAVMVRRQRGLL